MQEGARVGRVARLPLPRGAAQYEHVARLHKLLRCKRALLGELRLGQHRRYVLGRAERGVAPVLPPNMGCLRNPRAARWRRPKENPRTP